MVLPENAFEAIKTMLNAKSIAVVGASTDTTKLSGMIIPRLKARGFKGKIYPVNPSWSEVMGLKCHPSVKEISGSVDLAYITVPSKIVPDAVEDCAQKGVESAVIISAGFGETGAEGKKIQDEIVRTARKAGLRLCGPNCEGILSIPSNIHLTFCSTENAVSGQVALITQSGGVGEFVLYNMWERGIGSSHWISTGNEADLTTSDFVEYFLEDPNTKVICLFSEGIRNSEKFGEVAEMAKAKKKPIIVLKVGRSEKGRSTVLSHTCSLAGSDHVYDAFFKQHGIIRVDDLEDMYEVSLPLTSQPLPRGNRVGLVTDSGGVCAFMADSFDSFRLQLPDFGKKTFESLRQRLPATVTIKNPLDLTAARTPNQHAKDVPEYIDTIAHDDNIDIVVIVITWWPNEVIAAICEDLSTRMNEFAKIGKPLLACFSSLTISDNKDLIRQTTKKFPFYLSPTRVARAAKYMVQYQSFLKSAQSSKTGQNLNAL